MRGTAICAALSALCVSQSLVVAYPTEERHMRRQSDDDQQRADAVRDAFQFSWDGYMKYAFPHDELHPVSNSFGDSRNGWGASAVDALSTALIMDLPDVVDVILDHIAKVDYTKTDTKVSLFETTIRYLAGMISGYDLLTGPCAHLASDKDKVDTLLKQSLVLADVMKFAFDSKSGVPSNGLWIGNQTTDGSETNGIATIGTLILEWTRLSDLTNDDQYAKLAEGGEKYLLNPKPSEAEPFDGLIGGKVNIETGEIQNSDISWGGGDDSFYEYLIKMFVYDPERFKEYKDRWTLAVDSSMEHLKSSPKPRPDLTYLAAWSDGEQVKSSQHLACFSGGNFILGGQVLQRQDLVDFGLDLVKGCRQTYDSTATKIGPETFSWDDTKVPDSQKDFYEKNGFFITSSGYNLRPEVIESYYYAYQATGDRKYKDWVWEAFVAVNETTRTDSGFTAIGDVNAPGGGKKGDNQESFLFAEVMKYAYITHNHDGEWQVSPTGENKWVYNTEAHPVKVFNHG